jgi:hypothetical protein
LTDCRHQIKHNKNTNIAAIEYIIKGALEKNNINLIHFKQFLEDTTGLTGLANKNVGRQGGAEPITIIAVLIIIILIGGPSAYLSGAVILSTGAILMELNEKVTEIYGKINFQKWIENYHKKISDLRNCFRSKNSVYPSESSHQYPVVKPKPDDDPSTFHGYPSFPIPKEGGNGRKSLDKCTLAELKERALRRRMNISGLNKKLLGNYVSIDSDLTYLCMV